MEAELDKLADELLKESGRKSISFVETVRHNYGNNGTLKEIKCSCDIFVRDGFAETPEGKILSINRNCGWGDNFTEAADLLRKRLAEERNEKGAA